MSSCDISLVAVWPDQRQFTIMDRMAYDELPNRTVIWLRLSNTLHADAPCEEVESNGTVAIIPYISGQDQFFYLHVEGWVPYPQFAAGDERDALYTDVDPFETEESDVMVHTTPSMPDFQWLPGGLLEGDNLDELEISEVATIQLGSRLQK